MKALKTTTANYGPFATIEVLPDRYRCDNTDLPFSVVGQGDVVDADTVTFPLPIPVPEPVPSEVSNAQAREALIRSGISIASVNAALAAIADPVEREVAVTQWEYRTTIRRDAKLVVSMAGAMNLTPSQVDDLFRLAATL
jgi:hypothetical protein